MLRESPEMVANDVAWEWLVVLITLISLQEHATSLVMDIVIHELEITAATVVVFCMPVWVHVGLLTVKQGKAPQ